MSVHWDSKSTKRNIGYDFSMDHSAGAATCNPVRRRRRRANERDWALHASPRNAAYTMAWTIGTRKEKPFHPPRQSGAIIANSPIQHHHTKRREAPSSVYAGH